jgi:hypothetical protein
MKYLLGIQASKALNIESGKVECMDKIVVGEEVYNWLMNHDVSIDEKRHRYFVYNRVVYEDLGPVPEVELDTLR